MTRCHSATIASSRIWLATLALWLAGCSSGGPTPAEVYSQFSDRLYAASEPADLNLDVLVNQKSLAYLDSVAVWAAYGKPEEIEKLSPFQRFAILSLRIHLDDWDASDWEVWMEKREAEDQPRFDGPYRSYFRPIVSEGTLGSVDSYANQTGGQLYLNGQPIGIRAGFEKEETWKVDLRIIWQSEFDRLIGPYLSDRYKNQDRVDVMLRDLYSTRFSSQVYRQPIER